VLDEQQPTSAGTRTQQHMCHLGATHSQPDPGRRPGKQPLAKKSESAEAVVRSRPKVALKSCAPTSARPTATVGARKTCGRSSMPAGPLRARNLETKMGSENGIKEELRNPMADQVGELGSILGR